MKIKPLKILGNLIKVIGPALVAVKVSPEAGLLVATGLGGGALAKVGGKVIEKRTGYRLHKVAGPVAAIGTPALLTPLVAPDIVGQVCEVMTMFCANPEAMGGVLGVGALLIYKLASGVKKVAG